MNNHRHSFLYFVAGISLATAVMALWVWPMINASTYVRYGQLPCSVFVKPVPKGCHK